MMNFWNRLGAWRWAVATVAIILVFSMLGGLSNFLSLIILFAFIYFAIKAFKIFTKRGYFGDREDHEEDDASSWGAKSQAVKKHDHSTGVKRDGVITQSEEELFNELTSCLTEAEYDEPIPLQWSTLNPFKKKDKRTK